jgi:hypothetical protein
MVYCQGYQGYATFSVLSISEYTRGTRRLERVRQVVRSARCTDGQRRCHPGVRQKPDPGSRRDAGVRGHDHDATSAVC